MATLVPSSAVPEGTALATAARESGGSTSAGFTLGACCTPVPKGAPKLPYHPDCDCCKTHRRKLRWGETTQPQWEARGENGVIKGQRVLLTRFADGR